MRPTPAGRGGTARCCSPYNAILERLDTMDARIQQAVDDANAAMSAAVIQAGNAASSAADAAQDAADALLQAGNAANSAASAAQDAHDAADALDSIENTISTTLTTYLGTKVDKLTTAGLHLYSHTGATQGEEEPIDGTTSNTIPIRDGNGRMQAADPASGATDKTLVTANWVSQTGDSAPNNLAHRNAAETWLGEKKIPDINVNRVKLQTSSGNQGWRKVYQFQGTGSFIVSIKGNTGTRRNGGPILVSVAIGSAAQIGNGESWNSIAKLAIGSSTKQVAIAYDANTDTVGFYYNFPASDTTIIEMLGTSSTINPDIAITPILEDPATMTGYVIV